VGHVYEAGVVALEGYDYSAVGPLRCLATMKSASPGGGFTLVGVLPVQEDDEVGVLLQGVMCSDAFGDEVVGA
jgi:hypothetical protein